MSHKSSDCHRLCSVDLHTIVLQMISKEGVDVFHNYLIEPTQNREITTWECPRPWELLIKMISYYLDDCVG